MSADRLREAARLMREECYTVRRPYGRDEHFKLAVAEWLEAKAEQDDKGPCDGAGTVGVCNLCEHDYGHIAALAVADAYLGSES